MFEIDWSWQDIPNVHMTMQGDDDSAKTGGRQTPLTKRIARCVRSHSTREQQCTAPFSAKPA